MESDTSMPANSASGCFSQKTPGSTAANRMLSPLSAGAVNSADAFRPSPSERAKAVLARASRIEHSSPAQVPQPSNNTSLTEQPSLIPMSSLLERCVSIACALQTLWPPQKQSDDFHLFKLMIACSASLAPQASVEEVKHAPSSVMCSQVWTSLAANMQDRPLSGHIPSAASFGQRLKSSPQKLPCEVLLQLFQVLCL
jgi:hypothetical protein